MLARFPDGGDARHVIAERRGLGRMLEAHEAAGVTHALVSDSFFMESAGQAARAMLAQHPLVEHPLTPTAGAGVRGLA